MEFVSSIASDPLNMSASFDSACSDISPSWTSKLTPWRYGSDMTMFNQTYLPSSPTEQLHFRKNVNSLYYLMSSEFEFDQTRTNSPAFNPFDLDLFNLNTFNIADEISEACYSHQPRKLVARSITYYKRFGMDSRIVPAKPYEGLIGRQTGQDGQNRGRKMRTAARMECVFCKNLAPNDPNIDYRSHWLKNNQGEVICPVLRAYTCPLCKNKGGVEPHTVRYCPLKRSRIDKELQRYVQTHQPIAQPCA